MGVLIISTRQLFVINACIRYFNVLVNLPIMVNANNLYCVCDSGPVDFALQRQR